MPAFPIAGLLALSLAGAAAQPTDSAYQGTAHHRAELALYVADACALKEDGTGPAEAVLEACGRPGAARIAAFVRSPSFTTVPTLEELETAAHAIRTEASGGASRLTAEFGQGPGANLRATGTGSILAMPASEAALALADWLLERARDEVVFSFFRDLEKLFEDNPDVRILFPRTGRIIESAGILSYKSLVPTLRKALHEDLAALPVTMWRLAPMQDAPVAAAGSGKDAGSDGADKAASPAGSAGAAGGSTAAKSSATAAESTKRATASIVAGRAVAQIIERLMEIQRGAAPLVAFGRLEDLTAEEVPDAELRRGLRLFGRICREYESARVASSQPGSELVHALQDARRLRVFIAFVGRDLGGFSGSVDALLREHGRTILDLSAEIAVLGQGFLPETPAEEKRRETVARVIRVGRAALPLVTDDPAAATAYDFAAELWRSYEERDYHRAALLALENLGRWIPDDSVYRTTNRLLTLGTGLLQAESAEEMQSALTAAADPVGSFRARRLEDGGGTLAVVSYVGIGGGRERVGGGTPRSVEGIGGAWHGGAVGLLGLEAARPTSWGSIGVYGSVLDLGTLVSYRLTEGDDADAGIEDPLDDAPAIEARSLFAPGLFLTFGLTRDRPLTLGLGGQYAPRLRRAGDEEVGVFRLTVFAGLDLTLLRF